MNAEVHNDTLNVREIPVLSAENAELFRSAVATTLGSVRNIDIDLSQTMFIDSCGLGVLIHFHKLTGYRSGRLRVLNPTPPVRQILELTRLHRHLEITDRTYIAQANKSVVPDSGS